MNFYKLPESDVVINLDLLLCVGRFRTYTDSTKSVPIMKHFVKFRESVKGHPFSLELSKAEATDLKKFLTDYSTH